MRLMAFRTRKMKPIVHDRLRASYDDIKAASAHIKSMCDQSALKWDIHIYSKSRATMDPGTFQPKT